jgi:Leucine-rich repeat (LRR) protein
MLPNEENTALPLDDKELIEFEELSEFFDVKTLESLHEKTEIYIIKKFDIKKLPESLKILNHIEKLNILSCPQLTEIPSLLDFKNLTKLNLDRLKNLTLIPELPTSLEEFSIENCPNLILPESLSHCTKLEQFKISNCEKITKIDNLPNNLKEIDIDKCNNLEVLQLLSNFAKLNVFKINDCGKITEINNLPKSIEELVAISNCPNLSTLPQSLSDCTKLNRVAINNCEKITEINNLPKNLESFYSNGCQNITTLQSLSDFTKLKTFGIVDCDKITEINNLPTSIEELDIENCTNLTTLQSLSDFPELKTLIIRQCENLQTPLNGLQDCSNLQHFDIRDGEITEIPEITHLTKLKNLKFSGCASLTTLPDLSNLTNLNQLRLDGCASLTTLPDLSNLKNLNQLRLDGCASLTTLPDLSNLKELNLTGCIKLVLTPELTEKLSALEDQGCLIIYPKHFQPSDLTQQCKDRLGEVTEKYNRNKSKNEPNLENITTFFSRFLTEGISQRTKQTDSNIEKANKIAKSTESFLDFIEKNPQHLPWIDEVSKNYLAGCINQPVWGFFEINSLIQLVKEEKFLDKVTSAKTLFTYEGIKNIVVKNNPGDAYQVEAGNLLLIDLHQQLLKKNIIQKPWMGVPEKIAFENLLKDWPEKPNIKSELTKLKKEIEDKTHENYISILCGNQYADIWQQIAFPNNNEIKVIKDRYDDQISEESDSEKMVQIMYERLIAISEKLAQLTRAEIAKETNEINSQQPVSAQKKPDLQIQSEASSGLPISSDFLPTYEKGIIKFKIKSGSEDSDEKFYYNKKLANDEEYKEIDYTKEKEQKKILALLKEASEATIKEFQGANLDNNFFIAVMRVASEKRGIASINSEEEFNKCFNEALKEIDTELKGKEYASQSGKTPHQIAKYFSAQFQNLSEKDGYLTARKGSGDEVNKTPRRLFRVCTKENIKEFQERQEELATDNPSQHQELNAGPTTSPRSPRLSEGLSRSPSVTSDIGSA